MRCLMPSWTSSFLGQLLTTHQLLTLSLFVSSYPLSLLLLNITAHSPPFHPPPTLQTNKNFPENLLTSLQKTKQKLLCLTIHVKKRGFSCIHLQIYVEATVPTPRLHCIMHSYLTVDKFQVCLEGDTLDAQPRAQWRHPIYPRQIQQTSHTKRWKPLQFITSFCSEVHMDG